METISRNLTFSGVGQLPGGMYDEVILDGMPHFTEPVVCSTFKGCGVVRADSITVQSFFSLEGTLHIQDLRAHEFRFEGLVKSQGCVECKEVKGIGSLSSKGKVMASSFHVTGQLKLHESLEADVVDIFLSEKSSFVEISGKNVQVRKKIRGVVPKLFRLKREPLFIGDLIEGEEVYLEYGVVSQVFGDRVEIGPYAQVEVVEYRESLKVAPTAVVGFKKKV